MDNNYASLQYLTNNILAILPVRCRILHAGNPLHCLHCSLWAVVANCFCAIVAMHTLAMITSSEMHPRCIYLVCTLDITHMIKRTRLSPSSAGRACKQGYFAGVCLRGNLKYVSADGPVLLPSRSLLTRIGDDAKLLPFPGRTQQLAQGADWLTFGIRCSRLNTEVSRPQNFHYFCYILVTSSTP